MWDTYLFYFITQGIFMTTVSVIGLIGNLFTFMVLCHPRIRSSTNCLLLGMSVCDCAFLFTSMVFYETTTIYNYTQIHPYFYDCFVAVVPYGYIVYRSSQTLSVYLTVIVTIERWVAVCHPLRAKTLCTIPRACYSVAVAAVISLIFNLPRFWEKETFLYRANGVFFFYIRDDGKIVTETYIKVYVYLMNMMVMYVVPFVTLAVLNTRIALQVYRARLQRGVMTRSQQDEIKLATKLLVIVLLFFICNLLPFVQLSIEVYLGHQHFVRIWPVELTLIRNLLLTINHSANFIIYSFYGKKSRRRFLIVFYVTFIKRERLRPTRTIQKF